MILTMKKGPATTEQSKNRTENNTLMLFSSRYHGKQKMSMVKCRECGGVEQIIGWVCERCLVEERQSADKVLRLLVVPMEERGEKKWTASKLTNWK